MTETTFEQRFEKLQKRRENAMQFFKEELAMWMPLKNKDNEGKLHYYFMKYISVQLMISKSLEEFITLCIMNKKEAEENIGFPEEFDWVNHCVLAAQIHTGKGPDRLIQYSYIHASFDLIKHYELKILHLMLDEMEGKNKDFTAFLVKIDETKHIMANKHITANKRR